MRRKTKKNGETRRQRKKNGEMRRKRKKWEMRCETKKIGRLDARQKRMER